MVSHPSPLLSRSHRAFSHRGMFAPSERFARFFMFAILKSNHSAGYPLGRQLRAAVCRVASALRH